MSRSLEEVLGDIFDEQEQRFKDMLDEAKREITSCYDKYINELDNE